MMKEEILQLWLNNIEEIGLKTISNLIQAFGNVFNIYDAPEKLVEKYLTNSQKNKFIQSKNLDKYIEMDMKLKERGIDVIYPGHKMYPDKLLNIYAPPRLLYVRGKLNEKIYSCDGNIAVVGGRSPSVYGKEVCKMFGRDFGTFGINVISGMARGIDSMAHIGAIEAGGYTLAILGSGIDVPYPKENTELYSRILENGAIISEYGLGVHPDKGTFPMRNRIISGLSDGVLVVEARKKSGSLITAEYALEQGKQIYAVPGRLKDRCCEGSNNLIKSGAYCVLDAKDIVMDLKREIEMKCQQFELGEMDESEKWTDKIPLAPVEEMVYSCLSLEPKYIDNIIQGTGLGVTKTISVLFTMEEKGLIKQPVNGYYIVAI